MRSLSFVVLVLGAQCSIGTLRAEELPSGKPAEVGIDAAKLMKAETVVREMIEKRQVAGAVTAVMRHGKIVWLKAQGESKPGKAMTTDAIFRIYSMTKPITTVAAMILVDEGRLKLDDPVSQYLPEFKGLRVHTGKGDATLETHDEMTVRDLMRHTSGLTYGVFGNSRVDELYRKAGVLAPTDDLAGLVAKLGKLPLNSQPGTKFTYSVSTDVLGRLVEVVSGKTLDVYFESRIFKPLDMRDTGFFVPADKLGRFTAVYGTGEKGMLAVTEDPEKSRYRRSPKFLSGGGGLVSTARDYLRFCQMLANGGQLNGTRILQCATVREMTTNQLPKSALPLSVATVSRPGVGFGLGFSVRMSTNAAESSAPVGEFGWGGAASTHFWIAPEQELAVVALQQFMPYNNRLEMTLKPVIYGAIVR